LSILIPSGSKRPLYASTEGLLFVFGYIFPLASENKVTG